MSETAVKSGAPAGREQHRLATAKRRLSILENEDDDPILSAINLVDVFLVAIAILMIGMSNDPLRQLMNEDLTVIRDAGKPTMEVLVKQGESLSRFQSTGASIEGNGTKAGTAYQLSDGTMVYVPSSAEHAGSRKAGEPR